jgi:putative protein-disulfide isomerase
MCSWCYGIAPELEALKAHYKDELDYEIVMGGLRPYNTQTMSDLKDFLMEHWEEVEHRSGQKFNTDILSSTSITYDTEPPSRAVAIVRSMDASKAFDFFHACQKAFYYDNLNMHDVSSYEATIKAIGLDYESFKSNFESAEWKTKIKEDFERAGQLGVRSFPTILLEKDNQRYVISQGYSKKEDMVKRIHKVLGF